MKFSLLIILTFCLGSIFAQPGKVPVKEIDGKSYYVHTVEQGQTLWKIKKMYNVPLNDIMSANEGLTNEIKEGQEILIPAKVERAPQRVSTTKKPAYHTVEKGETVFGLTRKYDITEKQFFEWNPDAKKGLKVGDQLIVGFEESNELQQNTEVIKKDSLAEEIPSIHTRIGDSIVEHKVQAGETLYTLSKRYMVTQASIKEMNDGLPNGLRTGDVIRIKVKREKTDVLIKDPGTAQAEANNLAVVFKDKYTVALFAPLSLWKNAQLDARRSAQDEKKVYGLTKLSVDFYNGIKLALDSLEKAGISVNLKVFDTSNDSATVSKAIKGNKLENVDLIFGPFFKSNVILIAEYAKEHKIPMIIPVQQSNKVLFNNPYVSKSLASNTTKMQRMADYIAKTYPTANIILVPGKTDGDKYLANVFKDRINENVKFGDSLTVVEAQIGNYSTTEMKAKITKYRKNIIVVTSRSEGYVTNVVNKLIVVKNSWDKYQAELVLFGMEEWENFSAIDSDFKQKLDYHYVATQYVDYDSLAIKNIYKAFRNKIGYDPDEMGLNGFDLAFAYVAALHHFGSALANNMENIHYNGLINHFALKQVEQNSGFENSNAFILHYVDYKAVLLE